MKTFLKKLGIVAILVSGIGFAVYQGAPEAISPGVQSDVQQQSLGSQRFGGGDGTIGILPYKAKVSATDTTAGYLMSKLVAGTNVTITQDNAGANETLTISASGGGGGGSPGGLNTQVQFNDASNFGGDAGFTYNKTTDTVTIGTGIVIGSSNPFSDSAGTLTLQNVDALDATTESTIEAAIDTLANLTSVQGKTLTLGGNFITSGASSLTLTTTGATNVTLPTTGTLATLAGAESLTNKKLGSLTSNGFVKTSGGDGTLSVDTNTYLTGNQTITLSGDVSGSGTTGITTTIGNDKILEVMLKSVNTPTDEFCLTYESTTGDFEWQTCGGGGSGDITSVGDVTSGAAFDGTQGTALTFDNAGGDGILSYDGTDFNIDKSFSLGTAGVRLSADGDGAITMLGLGNGSDEDLTINLDDTANTWAFSSSTGVTSATFGGIALSTDTLTLTGTGTLNGLDAIDATGETTLEATLDLAGDISSTGMSSTVIGNDKILEVMLKAVNAPTDEYSLTYEATTGDFEWQNISGGGGTPGGSDTQIQFNDGGSFGGDAGLTFDKTTDFATLVGGLVSPVVIGGTGTTSTLTLQSTSGVGTTGADILFKVGNNGGTEAFRVFNSGRVQFNDGATAPTAQVSIVDDTLTTSQSLTAGLVIENRTAATVGAQKISPALRLSGKGWATTGSVSRDVSVLLDVLPVQGTAPTAQFNISSSVNGGAITNMLSVGSGTVFTSNGIMQIASGPTFNFQTSGSQTRWSIGNDIISNGFTGGAVISRVANSASQPNFAFVSDIDNGMYQSGTNALDFSTAGTRAFGITSLQNLVFLGSTSTATSGAVDHIASTKTYSPASGTGAFTDINSTTTFSASGSSSATFRPLSINYTLNSSGTQSGTATGIFLNATETALASMTHNLMDLQVGGTSLFKVRNSGLLVLSNTITAGGTTGNQTINKPSGTVNIAAAGTAVTITNSVVTANSIVYAIARTNDATCVVKNAVPGAGTVTINMTAACTAETSIGFLVVNE